MPRALRFMNSLIKLLRARNHQINIGHRATALIIDGETHEVKLLEKCTRKVIKEEPWRQTELIPTGLLALKLAHVYSAKEWVDGKQPLEQQLTKIVATLEIRSENEKQERAKRDKYRAEQDRLKAIQKRLEAEKAWEHKKGGDTFYHMLLSGSKPGIWTQFLSAVENKIATSADASISTQSWLKWAQKVRDSIDPLSEEMDNLVRQYVFPQGETM
ncbi:MAG: hypothetical protein IPL46_25670 [Saprospiraceae bacterium]|nr:hypothetical protein [Saprospiraceae bacterium]